ncbi:hypothetical protein GCM10010191_03820 [Actinomadura vinacea]|uniref:SH3 domain-containing protein n=1 Tax=Actinomadura vinacea TaxID=115336 RepID=A0ABP5VCU5_9ACTN
MWRKNFIALAVATIAMSGGSIGLAGPVAAEPAGTGLSAAESQACTAAIAKEALNIRSAASTGSKIKDSLKKGEFGCLISFVPNGGGYTACGGSSTVWYHVKVPKLRVTGYVVARCIKIKG